MQLTGALDGDLELSGAGSLCVNLEVCGLLHPQALGLQTAALRSAEAGITSCGRRDGMKERLRDDFFTPTSRADAGSVMVLVGTGGTR